MTIEIRVSGQPCGEYRQKRIVSEGAEMVSQQHSENSPYATLRPFCYHQQNGHRAKIVLDRFPLPMINCRCSEDLLAHDLEIKFGLVRGGFPTISGPALARTRLFFMYAKVFAQIFDSSIADDYELRHFFMDLLVLANSDGVVDMTHAAIAARTRMPADKVVGFLKVLEGPDPESRTPDAEGRRIMRLDDHRTWGWVILNYDTFRDIAREEQRRAGSRERSNKYRAKRKKTTPSHPVTPRHAGVTPLYASPSPSASVVHGPQGGAGGNLPEVEVPSWQEVQTECQKIGLVEWRARDWFDEMQQCGWRDNKNREVMDWRAYLARVRTWWERDGRPAQPPLRANGEKSMTPMAIKTIIEAKKSKAADLRAKHCSDTAIDNIWDDPKKRSEYFSIQKEIKALNNQLSNMA